jgi:membrane associated rhomboid family serine protease
VAVRRPKAIRRFPIVTTVVFVVTAAVNAAQLASASVLGDLERVPAGLHGDWWRVLTSLFVQDGGVAGTLSNLAFLLVIGVAAEQVTTRPRWLLGYFGAGLVGEFAGYAWQPVGGGNSVAVCGLAGIVVIAAWRADDRLPVFGLPAAMLWVGALLATWWPPLVGVGIVGLVGAARLAEARWRYLGVAALVLTVFSGAALAIDRNIHGAALLAGLVIALATYRRFHGEPAPASMLPAPRVMLDG